jgi:inner membrane protein
MDNITHTLLGVGLARAGLAQRMGRGTTAILIVASNLPDVDVVCLMGGPLSFLWRRTVTHSLLGGLALGLAAVVLFRRLYPHLSWTGVSGLTFLGLAGHMFCDLWNSYGTVLYWPLSWQRVNLDWVFILDVVIWLILGGALAASLLARRHEVWIWRGGLALLAGYVGLCAAASGESRRLLQRQSLNEGRQPVTLQVYPEPFGPTRFRGVAREGNHYTVYQIWPFQRRVELLERLAVAESTPVVAAARRSEAGRRLDWFFSTGVWGLAPDGKAALVYGLGFRTKLLPARAPFVFRVAPDGRVWRAELPSS